MVSFGGCNMDFIHPQYDPLVINWSYVQPSGSIGDQRPARRTIVGYLQKSAGPGSTGNHLSTVDLRGSKIGHAAQLQKFFGGDCHHGHYGWRPGVFTWRGPLRWRF